MDSSALAAGAVIEIPRVLTAVIVVIAAVAGAGAGTLGAVLLRRMPTGVAIPAGGCAAVLAVLWALVAARTGTLPPWWWPVPLVLAWGGVLLAAADLTARRLPDALTVPAYPVAAGLLGIAAAGAGNAELLVRGLIGALLWAGGYAAVRLVAPDALGGGDVKLAGSLGAFTAASSWPALLVAILMATLLTALVAAPARLLGRRDVAHGPAMLVAAWLVVLQAP